MLKSTSVSIHGILLFLIAVVVVVVAAIVVFLHYPSRCADNHNINIPVVVVVVVVVAAAFVVVSLLSPLRLNQSEGQPKASTEHFVYNRL
jgi:heme/copper-type cytochrome/quinol oxidase subunit 4